MNLAWLAALPWLAFVAALVAAAAGVLRLQRVAWAQRTMHAALWTAFGLSAATMAVLIALFVLVRVDVQYVFSYTSGDVPLRYRIAGAYAGREGSLVLWAMYAALVAAVVAWWHHRSGTREDAVPPPSSGGPVSPSAEGWSGAEPAPPASVTADASGSEAPASLAGASGSEAPASLAAGALAASRIQAAAGEGDDEAGHRAVPGSASSLAVGGGPRAFDAGPSADGAAGATSPEAGEQGTTASRAWTELVLALVSAAFLGAVAWQDTFAATSEFLLRNRPGGNGLNPTLLSPFILIHPPVMFLAYALTAVPLAAVVADTITGAQAWSRIGMLWSRIDWLLYTFAMGLGGIWAYYTLGFGGYWAWDPVEVANLLPWLALTLFLHVQLHHRRHGRYRHLGLFLGILPFLLTLFSTISTRSGLWVSVHAFTDPTGTFDPDPASRLLAILSREPGLQFHTGLFLVVLLSSLALWGRRLAMDLGTLGRTSRIVAGILGAAALTAALAPVTLLGIALEAGDLLARGRTGLGMMLVMTMAIVAPAAPLLLSDEPTRRPRLDLRTLNLVAVVLLGLGLIVLFLWHIIATQGWSTQTYIDRFPLLAAPAMLALVVFQAHALWQRRALWIAGGLAVLAAGAYAADALWGLLVLAIPLVVISVLRVLRAARAPRMPHGILWARGALWIAALLDVLFWLNPPTIRLGIVTWQPLWPTQLVFGLLAFLALHMATLLLAGATRRVGATHLLVGLLGGFYVAAVIAAASWWLHRTPARAPATPGASPRRRLHQVGLHGLHLAVALALLGYTLTTFLGVEEDHLLSPGEPVEIGGATAMLLRVDQHTQAGVVERFLPVVRVGGGATADVTGVLYWEPQSSSHYPLPATARMWHGDVYFAVDAVCIDPTGACGHARDWVRAYEASSRLPAGVLVSQVEVQAFTLPGIALVWGALFLWLYFMALVMRHGPEAG